MRKLRVVLVAALAVPCAVALTSAAGAPRVASGTATRVSDTGNLLENPGFEAGPAGSFGAVVPIPGWRRDGCGVFQATGAKATVVAYGVAGGPDPGSPGPANRGSQLFAGGKTHHTSLACQLVDLSAHSAAIDAGQATWSMAAWLGGRGSEDDRGAAVVCFVLADGSTTYPDCPSLVGPTAAGRGGVTGLMSRSFNGAVPHAARWAAVGVAALRVSGPLNDGLVDDVSFDVALHA